MFVYTFTTQKLLWLKMYELKNIKSDIGYTAVAKRMFKCKKKKSNNSLHDLSNTQSCKNADGNSN